MHVRRGDLVMVIKGAHKGKRGKIKRVLKNGRVQIEKVAMVKRHIRPNQKNQTGGIVDREGTIPACNVALWNEDSKKAERTRAKEVNGKKVRVGTGSNKEYANPGM